MTNDKLLITNEGMIIMEKMKYEKPIILDLGEIGRGIGDCVEGSGDTNICGNGNVAGDSVAASPCCIGSGEQNIGICQGGTNPVGQGCNGGSSPTCVSCGSWTSSCSTGTSGS